jgi:hypothetical protein
MARCYVIFCWDTKPPRDETLATSPASNQVSKLEEGITRWDCPLGWPASTLAGGRGD